MKALRLRIPLLVLLWFVGIGALGGGACMLIDPTGALMGMDALLPYFQVLPFADVLFQNYVFSGFSLIVVNGVMQLLAAVLIMKHRPSAWKWGMACGILLMAWICIQFVMFPMNFMDIAYFLFGLAETVLAVLLMRQGAKA